MPTPTDLILIGALLLALVTVESGGYFLTRVVRGHVSTNRLQQSLICRGLRVMTTPLLVKERHRA